MPARHDRAEKKKMPSEGEPRSEKSNKARLETGKRLEKKKGGALLRKGKASSAHAKCPKKVFAPAEKPSG